MFKGKVRVTASSGGYRVRNVGLERGKGVTPVLGEPEEEVYGTGQSRREAEVGWGGSSVRSYWES